MSLDDKIYSIKNSTFKTHLIVYLLCFLYVSGIYFIIIPMNNTDIITLFLYLVSLIMLIYLIIIGIIFLVICVFMIYKIIMIPIESNRLEKKLKENK